MADKRCENGHFIDESWDLCPYCPVDSSDQDVPVIRPTRVAPAEPPRAAPPSVVMPRRDPVPVPQPPPMERAKAAPAPAPAPVAAPIAPAPPAPAVPSTPPGDRSPAPMERTVAVPRESLGGVQAKRYVVGWLIGLNGPIRGESFPVRIGRNILGRDKKSDIVVPDDQASAHHADLVFRPEERRFILMDHNSTNGTYVNEMEIEPRRDLAGKDVVRIGSHKFLFMPLCHEGFYWDDEGALK